MAEHTPFRM